MKRIRRRKIVEKKLAMRDKESKSVKVVSEDGPVVKKEVLAKEEPAELRRSDNVDFMDEDSDGNWP